MSRDMKSAGTGRTAKPASKKSGGGMLVGVFIGLILGVVAALGVALYINKTPMPFGNKVQPSADGKSKLKVGGPAIGNHSDPWAPAMRSACWSNAPNRPHSSWRGV